MKRWVPIVVASAILAIVLFPLINIQDYVNPAPAYSRRAPAGGYGDIDGDGYINFNSSMMNDYWLLYALIDEYGPCDVNQDGIVNETDRNMVASAWMQSGGREDVNLDGVVNVLDLIDVGLWYGQTKTDAMSVDRVKQIENITGVKLLSLATIEFIGDVDGDGNLTLNDVDMIKAYAMGEIDRFPVQPSEGRDWLLTLVIAVIIVVAIAGIILYRKK